MKRSFKASIQTVILILLIVVIIQSALLLLAANDVNGAVKHNIQSLVITFFFIIFIYLIFMFYYVPFRVHKAHKELYSLIVELSDGNYDKKIDATLYDSDVDVQRLVSAIQKMLSALRRFDHLKTTKVFEQNQRIQQMINLLPQGVMILNLSGDLAYCNDVMRRKLSWIQDGINVNELILKNTHEADMINVITSSLRNGNNTYKSLVVSKDGTRQVAINGSIIRDREGKPTGGVYVLDMSEDVAKDKG